MNEHISKSVGSTVFVTGWWVFCYKSVQYIPLSLMNQSKSNSETLCMNSNFKSLNVLPSPADIPVRRL